MKIGIITILDGDNYGNRLQNYALQKKLIELGHTPETIRKKSYRTKYKYKIKKFFKKILLKDSDAPKRVRAKKFKEFNDHYIKYSKYSTGWNQYNQKLNDTYDCFVVGSDQVWNPHIRIVREDIDNYVGKYISPSKLVSYAASFGVEILPDEWMDYFHDALKRYRAISVREAAGQKIVSELTGNKPRLVPDPVFLIDETSWRDMQEKPHWLEDGDGFILTYFLGRPAGNVMEQIDSYVRKHNYSLVSLENEYLSSELITNIDFFSVSPNEFLWLVDHAKSVLTDSFHGTAFSILFHKSFIVVGRKEVEKGNNMSSRITTLLNIYGLNERFNTGNLELELLDRSLNEEHIKKICMAERNKGISFLKLCI